jgi:diguanylate cyclase (GGDEF)-like protein/PAS domain S-box-containing protein
MSYEDASEVPGPGGMPNEAELVIDVLEAARHIVSCADQTAVAEALTDLPESCTGGARLVFVAAGAMAEPAGAGVTVAPVLCRDRPAGELRLAGGGAVGAAVLPVIARLAGAALERIRALDDCRNLNEGLQLDRVYFEQLFEASPEAIVVLDGEDRVVRANREFERLFGYTLAEAQGRTINELIVPPELQESAVALTRDVAAGRTVFVEAQRRRKDGTLLDTSVLGTPVLVQGDQVAVYGIYRDITAQKEAEEALRRLSTTDELTGLFNRRGFFLLAEQQRRLAVRKKAELLLLYIDIDDFKRINDEHGHVAGDRVLADLSHILRSCFRDSDIVARLGDETGVLARMGGDEFVILAVDAGAQGEEILTTRLRERLQQYNEERGRPYQLSLSVGAVHVRPGPEVTVDSLIAAADRLMYENKRTG